MAGCVPSLEEIRKAFIPSREGTQPAICVPSFAREKIQRKTKQGKRYNERLSKGYKRKYNV